MVFQDPPVGFHVNRWEGIRANIKPPKHGIPVGLASCPGTAEAKSARHRLHGLSGEPVDPLPLPLDLGDSLPHKGAKKEMSRHLPQRA